MIKKTELLYPKFIIFIVYFILMQGKHIFKILKTYYLFVSLII